MAAGNEVTRNSRNGEETPLLSEQRESHGVDISETSTRPDGVERDEENLIDSGKANQYVGKTRGAFIILSLWGLIFLQGMLPKRPISIYLRLGNMAGNVRNGNG